ncbi:MAG TPA: hypothetical protein VKU88_06790 [Acidimicrobiales bacterium]|nr:hypothetical protein [Acidimicrobiales bacterium]
MKARRRQGAAGLAALLAVGLAGCSSAHRSAAPATSTPAKTAPASTAAPTTTTTPLPPDPQPSPEQASSVFMEGWIHADRAQSASVAVPQALATLYATRYAGQPLNDRGCDDAFQPLICTWGPYAYGSGSIYQVQLSPDGSRWYVSGLIIES